MMAISGNVYENRIAVKHTFPPFSITEYWIIFMCTYFLASLLADFRSQHVKGRFFVV